MGTDDGDRRRFLGLAGLAAATVLSGCASFARGVDTAPTRTSDDAGANSPARTPAAASNRSTQPTHTEAARETPPALETIERPSFGVSDAPIPSEVSDLRYPTLGTADATLTLYGSWKCPYTREFVGRQLGTLVDEFVRPGDVSLRYRSVAYRDGEPFLGPDAPRAAQAGLAVWDVSPDSFWSYFAYVFENQPQERFEWATTDALVRVAERAGAKGLDRIRRATRTGAYATSVRRTVTRADELGISTVPRVAYDGSVTAPTVDPETTRRQFERAARAR